MYLPIEVKENVIPRDVYVAYNMRLIAVKRNKLFWILLASLFTVVFALNIVEFFRHEQPFPTMLCIIAAGAVIAYFSIPVKLRTYFGKIYDKTPAIGAKSHFLLTSNRVEADTELSRGETNWAAFIGAVEHQNWLMLHLNNRAFFAIDTTKIVAPASADDIYALLKQNNIEVGLENIAQSLKVNK
jgi:hypothetical protein